MSLGSIRDKNKNKNTDSFAYSKIDHGTLSPEDVREIKEDVFYKFVKPINYKTFKRLQEHSELKVR